MKKMKKVYALSEFYGEKRVNLVLLLDPQLLAQAMEHLERGEVKEAVACLQEAADLYAGEWGTPAAGLYERIAEEGNRQRHGVMELDWATLKSLANQRVDRIFYTLYPVLTGGEASPSS